MQKKELNSAADCSSASAAVTIIQTSSPQVLSSKRPKKLQPPLHQSTPSDQSAQSSQAGSTKGNVKVVVFNMSTAAKGKKSKGAKAKRSSAKAKPSIDGVEVTTTPTPTTSSNASIDMTPKRSRSEAPAANSIGNVLYDEVHKKLLNRGRKLSPAKLQAKQLER